MEWIVIWGAANIIGFAFTEVLKNLAVGALEDYVKDFFKDCLKGIVDLAKENSLKKAFGQAQTVFLERVQEQLQDADLDEDQIKNYQDSLFTFLTDKEVLESLGQPFGQFLGLTEETTPNLNTQLLAERWKSLNLKALPRPFNWSNLAKSYLRKVKAIIKDSEELSNLLNSENLEKISQKLDQLTPIVPDFDLTRYQEGIKKAYSRLNLDTLALNGWKKKHLKLWSIFKPQYVLTEAQKTLSVLDVLRDTKNYKYTVILGSPGAGKSTLTRYKALEWSRQAPLNLPSSELPLLIELRNYEENGHRCNNFLEYLEKGSGISGGILNQKELDQWLKNNKSLVMFDGLDEILDPGDRENRVIDIINFTQNYPLARVLITSRVIGYEYQRTRLENANFKHCTLQDFDKEQIKSFIQDWHDLAYENETDKIEKRERLQKSIDNYPAFQELAGNPLLLTMMAILNCHEELPRDRVSLYEDASKVLIQKWEAIKYLPREDQEDPEVSAYLREENTYKDKLAMLREVAHQMYINPQHQGNQLVIDYDYLENTLTSYLDKQKLFTHKPRIVARAFIKDLTTRSSILCFVGGGYYGFVHRTFLEYFCATYLVYQFEKARTITLDQLKQKICQYSSDENWHEIICLVVSIIDESQSIHLLTELLDQDDKTHDSKNLWLVNRCLTEVRYPRKLESVIRLLLKKLQSLKLTDINKQGEIETAISKLEELINF